MAYVENGVKELRRSNLPGLIEQKFRDISTGITSLGGKEAAIRVYDNFQKELHL